MLSFVEQLMIVCTAQSVHDFLQSPFNLLASRFVIARKYLIGHFVRVQNLVVDLAIVDIQSQVLQYRQVGLRRVADHNNVARSAITRHAVRDQYFILNLSFDAQSNFSFDGRRLSMGVTADSEAFYQLPWIRARMACEIPRIESCKSNLFNLWFILWTIPGLCALLPTGLDIEPNENWLEVVETFVI
ncbi:hypothetical protein PG988_014915 [Apiospora saccharicola]